MPPRHPALPRIWLISDVRNDAGLEAALARLPRGSGLVYRHYHLAPEARRARFDRLANLARRRGHRVILAGTVREARRWRSDGCYCSPALRPAQDKLSDKVGKAGTSGRRSRRLRPPPARGLKLVTAHSLTEIAQARRARADAILLSPVFATRSHPGARTLGPLRFRLLSARARMPVIALGGMTAARARRLGTAYWAAIDGLASKDS